ncbi:ATP-grasp domain-containing protein [Sulfuriferula nivalis]|uniref:ATP-grasp domain-containing protein n=1 Tax=Sulfuriferula nivalis TaxID=2675298 RepID=A0A809RKK6_9PROT|nr:ATP-grasp domain-containing protein [Sulfuriferula nivalis]BBP02509.1 hypothetical protein SFSGTM_32170 [Sulfuriferula nivalis]
MRKSAFILFGGFTRSLYHKFIPVLAELDLNVLIIDLPSSDCYRNDAGYTPVKSEVCYTEGSDLSAILHQCKQWAIKYDIKGALNTIEEFTLSSAIAIDYLQLKGPSIKASIIASNKILQRAYFSQWSPPFSYISKGSELPTDIAYPAVIKASDKHGGQGIVLVEDESAALQALEEFNYREQLNFEEYIQGKDFSIETIVCNGVVKYDNLTEEENLFIDGHHLEMGYNIPAQKIAQDRIEAAYVINQKILKRMGFLDGISHAEYRITAEGKIYLMEIAARPPGDGIFAMYQLATGQLIEEAIIRTVLGELVQYPRPIRHTQQIYLRHTLGTLKKVSIHDENIVVNCFPENKYYARDHVFDLSSPATVRELVLEHKIGAKLGKMTGPEARLGWVILDAATSQELAEYSAQIVSGIDVVITN